MASQCVVNDGSIGIRGSGSASRRFGCIREDQAGRFGFGVYCTLL